MMTGLEAISGDELYSGGRFGPAGLGGSVLLVERLGNETIVGFQTASGEQALAIIAETGPSRMAARSNFPSIRSQPLLFPVA
jgi:hypothetical protein